MVSSSKLTANRRNAGFSTGPRTAAGKGVSSRNALKHGLLSGRLVLPDESAAEFDEFRERIISDLAPEGEIERILAERIAFASWRLQRVVRMERAVVRAQMDASSGAPENESVENQIYWAMVRDMNSGNQLERLRRYEVSLERSLFLTLHELERLQLSRAGERTSAPAVLDVNVSVKD